MSAQPPSPDGVAELQARVAARPDDPMTLARLGSSLRAAGRIAEAIDCFRRVLALDPKLAEAWFNLANAQMAHGALADAVESYRRALALKPGLAPAHFNLGNALRDLGQLDLAVEAYGRALATLPRHATLHMNLGNVLRRLGRLDAAIAHHRTAAALEPERAETQYNLANALGAKGERLEAIGAYRKVLALRPDFTDAIQNLAGLLLTDTASDEADRLIDRLLGDARPSAATLLLLGRRRIVQEKWAEAAEALRGAIARGGGDAEPHRLLGVALYNMKEHESAIAAFRQALAREAGMVQALNGLALALQARGHVEPAIEALREALRLKPDDGEVATNLGALLVAGGEVDEGIALLRRAVADDPANAVAFNRLAHALFQVGQLGESIAAAEAAIRIDPGHADAHSSLAIALGNQGRVTEASAEFERVLALEPDNAVAFSNLLFLGNYDADLPLETLAERHRGYGRRFEHMPMPRRAAAIAREPGRRLRVGYVSPDFRRHSVSYFAGSLLAAHDRSAVEVICYANVQQPDETTQRLRSQADGWRSIYGLTDAVAAEQVIADRIDILVDLAGHTASNRLGIFARRPAPVQVTCIGYPNSTGLTRMDYRLVDGITDPPGDGDDLHTERLVRLPRCFLAYQPPGDAPPVVARPSATAGPITFGSFNTLPKINAGTVAAWAAILNRVPGSRMLIKAPSLADAGTRANLETMFARHGVAASRLELLGALKERGDHLGLYNRIDLGLDCFPYNGTTTTCEALWMGVPVVTFSGDRHAGRVGASLLHAVGLDELVAPSLDGFIDRACALAGEPARLGTLHRTLRGRMQASPLCDGPDLARAIETAYREMWRRI